LTYHIKNDGRKKAKKGCNGSVLKGKAHLIKNDGRKKAKNCCNGLVLKGKGLDHADTYYNRYFA
jgi:hypothetical protein